MFRTLCSMSTMLIGLKVGEKIQDAWSRGADVHGFIFLVGLFILFLFSYGKQTQYVVRRVRHTLKKEQE